MPEKLSEIRLTARKIECKIVDMKVKAERQSVISLRVTQEMRQLVMRLQEEISRKRNRSKTMTDILEEAIRTLAKKEKIQMEKPI